MPRKPFFFNFMETLDYSNILDRNTDPLKLIRQLNLDYEDVDPNNSNKGNKILILTNKADIESDLLGIQFLKNGLDYIKILEEDIPYNFKYILSPENPSKFILRQDNNHINLHDIKLVIYRHFDPRFLKYLDGVYQIYYLQQWYHTFLNIQTILKCPWINDPQNTMLSENRFHQLIMAQECGFQIPDTIITNDPIEAKNFFDTHPQNTIIKTLHHHQIMLDKKLYRFLSKQISQKDLSKIKELVLSPVIFQRKIDKLSEIRITIVKNKVFACNITSNKKYIDIHKVKDKDLLYKEINLEKNLKKSCLDINKRLGLLMCSIDLIADKKGEIYFLETNPIGDWNWIEKQTKLPITDSVFNLTYDIIKKNFKT